MERETYPQVQVSGSPFECGFQHGAQAGDRIHVFLERLIDDLRQSAASHRGGPRGRQPQQPITRELILEQTMRFLAPFESYASPLVEEIRGVAAGARISLAEALLCNVRGEVAHYLVGTSGLESTEGCTAFAVGRGVTATGDVLAGQNSDQATWVREASIVLTIKPDHGPALLMFTHAGEIGYHGLNEAGICQFANAVPSTGWRSGLPHYPMKRILLEQATVEECLAVIRRTPVASPGNYVMADRLGRTIDVEVTPAGDETIEPTDDFVVHANHYLHPRLAPFNQTEERLDFSTCRSQRLTEVIRTNYGQVTVETMKAALSDHASTPATICGHDPGYLTTVASLIAEPDEGRMCVSYGNPCAAGYTVYSLP